MDCTPADRGVSLGRGTTLPHPGSRSYLWRHLHAPNSRYGHTRQTHRPSIAGAERFCRTVDRINPARVRGSYRRLGRGAFARDLASLCPLLQQHQNAPVIAQRCAGLSFYSTDREHHVTSDPRWASSLLRSDLGFRYTQGNLDAETGSNPTASSAKQSGLSGLISWRV